MPTLTRHTPPAQATPAFSSPAQSLPPSGVSTPDSTPDSTFGDLPPPDPLLFEITGRLAEIDVSHMDAFLAVPLTTQSELVNVVKAIRDKAVDAFNLASTIEDI